MSLESDVQTPKKYQLLPQLLHELIIPTPFKEHVEGLTRRNRRDIVIWRIRGGMLTHLLAAGVMYTSGDPISLIIGTLNLAYVGYRVRKDVGQPLRWNRIKRIYIPFSNV